MEIEPIQDTVVSEIDNHREKRVRKSVSRLSDVYDKTFDLKCDRVMKQVTGNGTKLGDIKRIQDACQRSKINGELAKNIHLLCYRSIGKAGKRLSEIKKFNGFNENDESEFKRRLTFTDKMKMEELKQICDLLNVHPSGKMKKDISLGIIEYLKSPFETGSETFRTCNLRKKIKKVSKKTGEKKKKKKSVIKGKTKSESSVDNDSSISDIEMEGEEQIGGGEEEQEEEEEEEELENPKKTRKIKEKSVESDRKPKNPKKEKSEGESGKSMENENGDVEMNKKNSVSSLSQSNDLSDEILKEKISAILSGADLSKITLNQVCDGVVEQFPDVDLVLRRPYIKSLVKQVLDQAS